jgi:hypothetical protein
MLFGCQVTRFECGKIGGWYHEEAMLLCGVSFFTQYKAANSEHQEAYDFQF